jgi:hypothetical protein
LKEGFMSKFPILRLAVSTIFLMAALAGCKDSPTDIHSNPPTLHAACVPLGAQVSCTATFFDGNRLRDVTSQATWLVSNPALGSFTTGIFTPRQRGEVVLSVRYLEFVDPLESRFLVDPAQPLERREAPDLLAAGRHGVVGDVEGAHRVEVALDLVLLQRGADGFGDGQSSTS